MSRPPAAVPVRTTTSFVDIQQRGASRRLIQPSRRLLNLWQSAGTETNRPQSARSPPTARPPTSSSSGGSDDKGLMTNPTFKSNTFFSVCIFVRTEVRRRCRTKEWTQLAGFKRWSLKPSFFLTTSRELLHSIYSLRKLIDALDRWF